MTGSARLWLTGLLLVAALPVRALDLKAVTLWAERAELGTPLEAAVVRDVLVRPGQRVAQGAELVRLDARMAEAAAEEAGAAVEQASQNRAEARRELDRAQELYDRTVLSQHELDTAKIAAAAADAAYRHALAVRTRARLDLEYTAVRAPYDALVLGVDARPGLAVANAQRVRPLVTLAAAERIRARGLATAEQIEDLRVGDPARLATGGRWLDAEVVALGLEPAERNAEGRALYAVEAELAVPEGELWRAGRQVTLRIEPRP